MIEIVSEHHESWVQYIHIDSQLASLIAAAHKTRLEVTSKRARHSLRRKQWAIEEDSEDLQSFANSRGRGKSSRPDEGINPARGSIKDQAKIYPPDYPNAFHH